MIQNETTLRYSLKPELSLIDNDWIGAKYIGEGSFRPVSLKTLFLDSHKIEYFEIPHAAAEVAFLRILISIAYNSFLNDFPDDEDEWNHMRRNLIIKNQGFSEDWVNQYFEKYKEHFYLIHPQYPFLQDISLLETTKELRTPYLNKDKRLYANQLQKTLDIIDKFYPLAPSTNQAGGEKVSWSIPKKNVYNDELPIAEKINLLVSTLLYQLYSTASTPKGQRYYQDGSLSHTHTASHAFKAAIHFVPRGNSLYSTILLALDYFSPKLLLSSIPTWEDEESELKYGISAGTLVELENMFFAELKSPRSSPDWSQTSMLFIPEFSFDKKLAKYDVTPGGGVVSAIRRLRFDFDYDEHGIKILKGKNKDKDKTKAPFSLSWNPYVLQIAEKKVQKQTEGITPATALQQPQIYFVPLLKARKDGEKLPSSLSGLNFLNLNTAKIRNVDVYISAEESTQDKKYNDFVLRAKTTIAPKNAKQFEEWYRVSGLSFNLIKESLDELSKKSKPSKPTQKEKENKIKYSSKIETTLSHAFWYRYSELFNNSLTETGDLETLSKYQEEVMKILVEIYEDMGKVFKNESTLDYYNGSNKLKFEFTHRIMEGIG